MMVLGWGLVRVRGNSMAPTLRSGDLVVVRQLSGRPRRSLVGSVVCVRHPDHGFIIKRITGQQGGRYTLAGDGVASTPAVDLGAVEAGRVVARVRGRLPRLPGVGATAR